MFDSAVLTWHFESGVNEEFLLHLYDIRLAFEPFAASLVAERASSEEIELLRRLAMSMAAPEHTSDSLAFADLHFHLAITEASHNPFMRSLGGLIEAALVGMFRTSAPPSATASAILPIRIWPLWTPLLPTTDWLRTRRWNSLFSTAASMSRKLRGARRRLMPTL